jgi:uncharacterized membrane protein YagU involved in acid resistance
MSQVGRMEQTRTIKDWLLWGAIAGAIGSLAFQVAAAGMPGEPASALGSLIVQTLIGGAGGAGFGVLMSRQRPGAGEMLLWGTTFGLLWWLFGTLTLVPLIQEGTITWDVHAAQDHLPAMLGSLLYGTITGLALAVLWRRTQQDRAALGGPLARGALAGLLGGWLLGTFLSAQNELMAMNAMMPEMMESHTPAAAWLVTLLIGLLAGGIFAWLYPHPFDGSGAALMRGSVYGFVWWVVGAQTLAPFLSGDSPAWALGAVRDDFATLPGYLLFGAGMALIYQWLDRLVRLFFADDLGRHDQEGIGTQGLRALGRGVLAGLAGGLLFTLVMAQVGFLPGVASLVGSASMVTGLIVHLIIASVVGVSYGLFFRFQSYDLGSALGWGVSYGFFWWVLGSLTLMPVLAGSPPQWTVSAAADAFPALVGHLVYGADLGAIIYLLEERGIPWWISRSEVEAARIARRQEQILTSAPAIWVLVVAIALILPVILGM